MIIHIPLWKGKFGNDEVKRVYLRFESVFFKPWRSGGRNSNGSFKKYYRGFQLNAAIALTHDKVDYVCTYDDF